MFDLNFREKGKRALVRFEEVVLRYGNGPEILKRVSLQLDPGPYHFLVGPSGAGKSSLLRMMYLAQHPSAGRVVLFGRDVAGPSRRATALLRRRLGVVFPDARKSVVIGKGGSV